MEIRSGIADFSSPSSGGGPRTLTVPVLFPTAVQQAAIGINGYTVAYGDGDDHHIGLMDVQVEAEINDNLVLVIATLGLRDWSGDWDDSYYGSIAFTVLADLAPVPPRPDLVIAGLETNQAVQFFRSAAYLTPSTAVPDNAIPLYAGKNTGLRVYPDWIPSLGLPLTALAGQILVKAVGTTFTFAPLNTGGAIQPRPDSEINPAVIDHTLNFMIPAAICTGTVEVSVQLWDQANPTQKSGLFTRTLVFTQLPQLNIFVVGVNYTANGLNLPAPTQAEFTAAGFAYLQQVYPQGTIVQTGYQAIAFNEDVNFTIGSGGGCGSGMGDLLDRMDDMRGGSLDVYLAVLPPLASIQTPGSNIGGCGRPGVGAVFVDQTLDVPHEVGHALGRSHAPCSPGACSPMPTNVDPNYPSYGTFPAGSIGVFGFDPVGNQVLNPANTFDTMAYRCPQWISAYTYLALAGAGSPSLGGTGAGLGAHATGKTPIDLLFLSLAVARDRAVDRRVSFHFRAAPRSDVPCTEVSAELLDIRRRVLTCAPLSCECDDVGHGCWPRTFRGALPFPHGSRWLRVWEGDCLLHEEWIPNPPHITVGKLQETEQGVVAHWHGTPGEDDDTCCGLWYLVQWYDGDDEVWRGVAPRTEATSLLLPNALLHGKRPTQFRILASCGIATGAAGFTAGGRPLPRDRVILVHAGQGDDALGPQLTAVAVALDGRHRVPSSASWTANGRELSGGPSLHLRVLSPGETALRVTLQSEGRRNALGCRVLRDGDRYRLLSSSPVEPAPAMPHAHPHGGRRAVLRKEDR